MKKEKEYTLEEIRKAQAEISGELAKDQLPAAEAAQLEQASTALRNLERALVQAEAKELLGRLKKENESLVRLTKLMAGESERLFRINDVLQRIIRKTGKVIDILDLVR